MDKKEFNCNDDSEVLFLGVGDGEIEIADDTKLKTRSEKFPIPELREISYPTHYIPEPDYIPEPNQPVEFDADFVIDEPVELENIPENAYQTPKEMDAFNPGRNPEYVALEKEIEALNNDIELKKKELETSPSRTRGGRTRAINLLETRFGELMFKQGELYARLKEDYEAGKPIDVAPEKPKRVMENRRVPEKSKAAAKIVTESEWRVRDFNKRASAFPSELGRRDLAKRFKLDGVFRFIAPEVAAAYGKKPEEGVILDPSLVAVFKGAIEEEGKTGFAVMDTFARVYGRKLLMATANPEGHRKFLNDPVLWSQATIDSLIRLARAASAGDADALAMLESAYTGVRPQVIKNLNSGRVEAHPKLRRFAEFSKKWLRSVFGKNANIYFFEDLKGATNPELADAYKVYESKGGRVNAFINMDTGNVFIRKDANPIKVFHEVFGHATWHWLKNNDRKGYEKLRELAENAPQKLKDKIARVYGAPDPALKGTKEYEEQMDYYLDEVFAHLMELKYSGRIDSFLLKESVARERCSRNAFHKSNRDVRKKASCYAGELLKTLASLFFDWKGCQTTGV